jgi:cobalt-zinc-cadmium efflux system outer membrane protein
MVRTLLTPHAWRQGLLASVLCWPIFAHATQALTPTVVPELSVDQITRMVLDHNPQLQATRSSVEGARAGVSSAQALHNPRLEWQQGPWRPVTGPGQRAQSWAWVQPIDNPWLRTARIEAAQSGARWSEQQLAGVRNDLVAQVRLRAYEALLNQAEAESAAAALGLLEQVRERVRVRVESGEAARYEIIKADAEVIHARERQRTSALQAEHALLELNRLAAGQLPARWRLNASFNDGLDLPDMAQLLAQAERFNPDVLALRHEFERAQAQWRAAQASRWPGLELRYSETRDPEVRQSQWGVSMQLPLLDQRTGPLAEAQAELERTRTRLEGRQAELRQQVLLAWKALDMARLRVDALSQGVLREAEAALRVAQAAYRFGERGILDVLDAQRVLRDVRADLLQARYQQQAARIALDQLSGQFALDPQP